MEKQGLVSNLLQKRPGRDLDIGFGCPGGIPVEEPSCDVMRTVGVRPLPKGTFN